jgi:Transposase DDE domain
VDSASVRAKRGDHVGADPVDRGKPGSKIHLACEGHGLPLTAVTAANIPDVTMLAAVLDDVPAVLTPAGRRRTRPGKVDADKTSHAVCRQAGVGCVVVAAGLGRVWPEVGLVASVGS